MGVQALSGPCSRHRCGRVEDEITYLKHVVLWLQCRGFSAVFDCVIITTKAETPTSGAKSCISVPDTIQLTP